MVKLCDVMAWAWAVRKLRAALRKDDTLTGETRKAVEELVKGMDSTRELGAIAVRQRAARRARAKVARGEG